MDELVSKLKDALVWAHGDILDESKYIDMVIKIFGKDAVLAFRTEYMGTSKINVKGVKVLINIYSASYLWELDIWFDKTEKVLHTNADPIKNLSYNNNNNNGRDISYTKKKS